MSKSTTYRHPKPSPDFPLFPHASNRWCKKIKGKAHYFGKVLPDDPKGEQALQRYLDTKDDLFAGRTPRAKSDVLVLGDCVNLWLDAKRTRLGSEDLTFRTWEDYRLIGAIVVETIGRSVPVSHLGPRDFGKLRDVLSKRWGPTKLRNNMQYVRGIFNWAKAEGLIAETPLYGTQFEKPAAKQVRAVKSAKGQRMMTPAEIRELLATASPNVKVCILLAANAGVGPSDLARLTIGAIDLKTGWISYPRHKTGVARRFPLWPETAAAIREALAVRPAPAPGSEDVLLLRTRGQAYTSRRNELISDTFRLEFPAAKHTLYDLRRGFQTIGEQAGDPVAVSAIMGHAPRSNDMAAMYRQAIDDDRLRAVVDVVHDWLFGQGGDGGRAPGDRGDDDRQDPRKSPARASESTKVQRAVIRCLRAIENATGPDKQVLASVWNSSEIALALSGDHWTAQRFLQQWGDDRSQDQDQDQRPRLRLVTAG